MRRARFLPVFLASFAVTLSLLAPGAIGTADAESGRSAPVIAARA